MKRMKQASKVTKGNAISEQHETRETCTFEDIHRMLFKGRRPKPITVEEMDEAIAQYVADKYTHGRR